LDPSLKDGRGDIPSARKPLAGINPSGECLIQMVPPVMMMSTRASGYWVAMLPDADARQPDVTGDEAPFFGSD
jgi:hypothetical protein